MDLRDDMEELLNDEIGNDVLKMEFKKPEIEITIMPKHSKRPKNRGNVSRTEFTNSDVQVQLIINLSDKHSNGEIHTCILHREQIKEFVKYLDKVIPVLSTQIDKIVENEKAPILHEPAAG